MFDPTADFAHKCMKAVVALTRRIPEQVEVCDCSVQK